MIHFLCKQLGRHLLWFSTKFYAQRIGKTVCRIGRKDEGFKTGCAARTAVAAAQVVFPTPPFPVNSKIRLAIKTNFQALTTQNDAGFPTN